MKKNKKYLLLVGPLIHQEEVGGIVVLFDNLLKKLDKLNIDYIVVDTNKKNYKNTFIAIILIYFKILRNIQVSNHISLHGTANDYLVIAPFVMLVSKVFRIPYSLRKFAGNFHELYMNYNLFYRQIIKFVLQNSSANFFETKYLVNYFKSFNQLTFLFPNVRNKQVFRTSFSYKKKFVFLGKISKEKGIDLLIEVSQKLSPDYTFDVYGRISRDYDISSIRRTKLNYKGELAHENVVSILKNYDALILPSFREGYPGVIVEAFSVGLPVVASKLESIEEMVRYESISFFEVGSTNSLLKVLTRITASQNISMKKAALKEFKEYDSDIVTTQFLEKINRNSNELSH